LYNPSQTRFDFPAIAPFISAWRNRLLIRRLVGRELSAKWRGTLLGATWSFVTPLLTFAVYSFVFTQVFVSRWTTQHTGAQNYPLLLFTGILTFSIFSETINRAPVLILEHAAYVKKVVFPLEILPWVILLVAFINAGFGFIILICAYLAILGLPPLTALLLPVVLAPLCLICLGLGWLLASLGVFVRDVRHFVSVATTLLMFLSPVFYSLDGAPKGFQQLLMLNPLSIPLEGVRAVLFWGELPDAGSFAISLLEGFSIAIIGWVWFAKTRKAFADVL
jgi:lipopolysaccharide transport system permease protein